MNKTGSHFPFEKLRTHWSPVLNTWSQSVIEYTEKYDSSDFLCWYNERASLSTLAGAFWLNQNYALEEFSNYKSSMDQGDWTGRTDLWVVCGRSVYCIEAKQVFVSAGRRATKTANRISKALQEAKDDAKASKASHERGVGLVFAPFRIPQSEASESGDRQDEFIKMIRTSVKYDFMAYACPASDELVSDSGRLYLGCILVGALTRKF